MVQVNDKKESIKKSSFYNHLIVKDLSDYIQLAENLVYSMVVPRCSSWKNVKD